MFVRNPAKWSFDEPSNLTSPRRHPAIRQEFEPDPDPDSDLQKTKPGSDQSPPGCAALLKIVESI